MTDLGLIYTSGAGYTEACRALGAGITKSVPAWGLSPDALAATGATRHVLRTSWGDPSYAGDGRRAYPVADRVLEELRPYRHLPGLVIEIGNEPNTHALSPAHYAARLEATVAALRAEFPGVPILPPALSYDPSLIAGVPAWLDALAPVYRQCHALTYHAYSAEQARTARDLLRRHVAAGKPLWLTECNVNAALSPAERAVALREVVDGAEVALLYHWCEHPGEDAVHFNRNYLLTLEDLRAMNTPAPIGDHWPTLRVDGFALDVRRWRTVAEFRAHLARYRYQDTAPWARGCVVHHTWKPVAAEWRGVTSVYNLAKLYRTQKRPPWNAGPHLFICPDAPDPEDRGIWQMTPLNVKGIHAGSANAAHWGVEHVCDASTRPMPSDVVALGAGAVAALLDWANLGTSVQTVTPHSQWGKPECPGAGVDMAAYRRAVAALREG